jgi:arylsulfatase
MLKYLYGPIFILLIGIYGCTEKAVEGVSRPNIILILADDMGYSDIGCYGGEISTPNIDRLAENGLRYTNFYNAGRCCPTRASLLTGLYSHQTGMGWMTAGDLGYPGYTGDINNQCVTIGEVLKEAGYATWVVGKWHVTHDDFIGPDGPKHNWPLQRGFEKYYGPQHGGGSYFTPGFLTNGNDRIETPSNYYTTDAFSDTASQYILMHDKSKPFFMYLAYTAPHFPIHAKPEDIAKYEGKYMKDWDEIRRARYERMKEMGIIEDHWKLSEKSGVPDWNDLTDEKKREFDKRMAVYAAQIDCMDQWIGKVVESLKKTGQFDNTVILFMSDNGGTAERIGPDEVKTELIGTNSTYQSYRRPWATVSNTPFRMYKQWVHEGGTSTPLIVHWPDGISGRGELRRQVGHVIDLMPTCIELAGAKYPETYKGHEILPYEGISLVESFTSGDSGTDDLRTRRLYYEHQATRAVRSGDWKLVADREVNVEPFIMDWELYNLAEDRSETNNLAGEYPDKVRELDSLWNAWAERCNVYPLDGRGWFERLE